MDGTTAGETKRVMKSGVDQRRAWMSGRMPGTLRFSAALMLASFLGPLHPATVGAQGAPREVREAAAQVLTLRGYDAQDRVTAQGSGFLFGPGRIATNVHVIEGAETVRVLGPAGDTLGTVRHAEAIDRRLDLAILPSPGARSGGLTVETFFPEIGDPVWTYGSPRGLTGTMSDGIVSAIRERGGRTVLQISAPISPGSSGGPVLDARGRVVGVTVSSVRGGQNLNFAVPARELARLAARRALRLGFPAGDSTARRTDGDVGGDDVGGAEVGPRPELPERWRFLSRNVSNAELFYDSVSMRRDDDRLRVWIYTFYPEVLMAGEAGFDSSKALFEVRCDAQEFRLNQYLLLRGENVIGSHGSVSGGEWSAAAPESIAENLMGSVCSDADEEMAARGDEAAAGADGEEEAAADPDAGSEGDPAN